MKQHITISQLNGLSEKGKEKLRNWWMPKFLSWGGVVWDKESYPEEANLLLSIGQMIEFLDEKLRYPFGKHTIMSFTKNVDGWAAWLDITRPLSGTTFNGQEFCDALWEAVKEVLEK